MRRTVREKIERVTTQFWARFFQGPRRKLTRSTHLVTLTDNGGISDGASFIIQHGLELVRMGHLSGRRQYHGQDLCDDGE